MQGQNFISIRGKRIKHDQDQWYHDQDRSPDDIWLDQMFELFH